MTIPSIKKDVAPGSHSDSENYRGRATFHLVIISIAVVIIASLKLANLLTTAEVSASRFHAPPLGTKYRWSEHQTTAVIVIRHGCHFCKDSLPFYSKLLTIESHVKSQCHVIFVMPGDEIVSKGDLPGSAGRDQVFYSIPLEALGVAGTPTLLMVDRSGRVDRAWQGELKLADQWRVINLMN
jgi:hypothetical protein